MLHSSKAKEIASVNDIDQKIYSAALKGEFRISLGELSKDAEDILRNNGYSVTKLTSDNKCRYDISWD